MPSVPITLAVQVAADGCCDPAQIVLMIKARAAVLAGNGQPPPVSFGPVIEYEPYKVTFHLFKASFPLVVIGAEPILGCFQIR
jgi:hypothetical protein